jgi:uncharacterized protein (DUF2147 family)
MKKITGLAAAAALAATLGIGGASMAGADGHNERSCEANGGTWTNDQGTKTCAIAEEGKNDRFECTTTESGQGNLGNKPGPTTETEEGTGSGKCPPGQYN